MTGLHVLKKPDICQKLGTSTYVSGIHCMQCGCSKYELHLAEHASGDRKFQSWCQFENWINFCPQYLKTGTLNENVQGWISMSIKLGVLGAPGYYLLVTRTVVHDA